MNVIDPDTWTRKDLARCMRRWREAESAYRIRGRKEDLAEAEALLWELDLVVSAILGPPPVEGDRLDVAATEETLP